MATGNNIIHFPGAPYAGAALQIRVELLLMPEPVWRRLLVPANYSFWDLHVALQDCLGWMDCHLHMFSLDDPVTGRAFKMGIPDESDFHGASEVLPGWDHLIGDFLRPASPPILYHYDFGDGWQHEVLVESLLEQVGPEEMPCCLDGTGNCPAEDCGGPPGWAELRAKGLQLDTFNPESVVFDDPRQRWRNSFGPK